MTTSLLAGLLIFLDRGSALQLVVSIITVLGPSRIFCRVNAYIFRVQTRARTVAPHCDSHCRRLPMPPSHCNSPTTARTVTPHCSFNTPLVVTGFLVVSVHLQPNVKLFQNNFKMAVDSALLINLVLAMLMKVDLEEEDVSEVGVGASMLFVIIGFPAAVITWEVLHGRIGENESKKLNPRHKAKAIELFKTLDNSGDGKLQHEEVVSFVLSTRPDWIANGLSNPVSDLPCHVKREGGYSLVIGGPSLVI